MAEPAGQAARDAPSAAGIAPAVELVGIDKRFGPVHANRNVDLRIPRGTIHGIVGENGAGKSTLMNILYGYYQADRGVIRVDGQERQIHSPEDAIRAGIGMVHQHFMLVEPFTVLENLLLGAEGGMTLAEGARRARQDIAELEREYGLEVELDATVADLPVGVQQRVEILKALFRGARILILDEPTGALTPQEADHLFRILRNLRDQGRTVVLITHKLREIMAVTDNVSVMRRGEMVAHRRTAETSTEELAELMVGRKVLLRVDKGPARPGAPVLEVADLVVRDGAGVTRVKGVSFTVRAGEIVGIAGVAGNGQSELLEALAGIRPIAGGRVAIKGHAIGEVAHARTHGLGHVPEDRLRMGLVPEFAAYENAILGYQLDPDYSSPRLPEHGRHHRHLPALDARLRRAPGRRAAQGARVLGRQSAEAGARARAGARPRPAAGRAADPRRRHRRDRVHPQAPDRRCATPARRCCWSRSSWTRSCRSPTASW